LVRGYPLEMILAEKLVTAIARGSANTRWRDFVDIYSLARKHTIAIAMLRASLERVARHRHVELVPLCSALTGYAQLAQPRWLAWLRKNRLESTIPVEFSDVVDQVCAFADPVIVNGAAKRNWNPRAGEWIE
jgi:hypothetical protein